MPGYKALKITAPEVGLIQDREDFLLPNDGFPVLENAYVWRGRIKRKQGFVTLGRLRRDANLQSPNNTNGTPLFTTPDILISLRATEPNAGLELGNVIVTVDPGGTPGVFQDDGLGNLVYVSGPYNITSGFVNYVTGQITLNFTLPFIPVGGLIVEVQTGYYPCLPVMGIRRKELNNISFEDTIYFDTKYAYRFGAGIFSEFIPGTTWTGTDSDFFWSTNYWVDNSDRKLFWVTNFSGTTGDPIRYTNGSNIYPFSPIIDVAGNQLTQSLVLLPFRGRLLALNTFEGPTLLNSVQKRQRIRWSAIGNPITIAQPPDITVVNANAWRDDIIGQGGFLDIPTAEDIVTAGFVRDNLVIYCERSTWQLRYTGRSIAPFQIEKVNTELGAESTFSAVNFDTSLVGIGDKGIVECDSFKSERIDTKIPDLVFKRFHNDNDGPKRVHGIRDLKRRLVYWIYPDSETNGTYPNRRLVLNYEEGSWGIFKDLFTAFGNYQETEDKKWQDIQQPWNTQNYAWVSRQSGIPLIVAGNQHGYIVKIDRRTTNTESFHIKDIIGATPSVTTIVSPNHNLEPGLTDGDIIEIVNIPAGTGYSELNNNIYQVYGLDAVDPVNSFTIAKYDPATGQFTTQETNAAQTYIGGGEYRVIDNFKILSKKFDHMDEGQKIQLGYIDLLVSQTATGAFTMKLYSDYRNKLEMNQGTDSFFNTIVPTTDPGLGIAQQDKYWHRVFCNIRSNFIQLEYTLSDAQMNGQEREEDVEIDAQILYERTAGRIGI